VAGKSLPEGNFMMSLALKCPTCKKKIKWDDNPSRPFCSERCRLVDLGAWASGDYRISTTDKSNIQTDEEQTCYKIKLN
jgi:hypothetical protein